MSKDTNKISNEIKSHWSKRSPCVYTLCGQHTNPDYPPCCWSWTQSLWKKRSSRDRPLCRRYSKYRLPMRKGRLSTEQLINIPHTFSLHSESMIWMRSGSRGRKRWWEQWLAGNGHGRWLFCPGWRIRGRVRRGRENKF